jgi:hypothetical protein
LHHGALVERERALFGQLHESARLAGRMRIRHQAALAAGALENALHAVVGRHRFAIEHRARQQVSEVFGRVSGHALDFYGSAHGAGGDRRDHAERAVIGDGPEHAIFFGHPVLGFSSGA